MVRAGEPAAWICAKQAALADCGSEEKNSFDLRSLFLAVATSWPASGWLQIITYEQKAHETQWVWIWTQKRREGEKLNRKARAGAFGGKDNLELWKRKRKGECASWGWERSWSWSLEGEILWKSEITNYHPAYLLRPTLAACGARQISRITLSFCFSFTGRPQNCLISAQLSPQIATFAFHF